MSDGSELSCTRSCIFTWSSISASMDRPAATLAPVPPPAPPVLLTPSATAAAPTGLPAPGSAPAFSQLCKPPLAPAKHDTVQSQMIRMSTGRSRATSKGQGPDQRQPAVAQCPIGQAGPDDHMCWLQSPIPHLALRLLPTHPRLQRCGPFLEWPPSALMRCQPQPRHQHPLRHRPWPAAAPDRQRKEDKRTALSTSTARMDD